MKLKELEHEGTEEYTSFPNRTKIAKIVRKQKKKQRDEAHERKVKLQEAWLSVNNPLIFDGDFDA